MDRYEVTITEKAQEDILSIGTYLKQFYPSTKSKEYAKLSKAIQSLEEMPYKFRDYQHERLEGFYKKMIVGRYLVIYSIEEEPIKEVVIQRVLNGKVPEYWY